MEKEIKPNIFTVKNGRLYQGDKIFCIAVDDEPIYCDINDLKDFFEFLADNQDHDEKISVEKHTQEELVKMGEWEC